MNAATCSARVASAAASRRSGSQACSRRRTVGSGRCRCSVAARLPVDRRRARYRSTLRSDTPNRSAACRWVIPASTAATTRSRKSIEYARTPDGIRRELPTVNQPALRCQSSMDAVLATLLNELDAAPGDVVLVLDDYHL